MKWYNKEKTKFIDLDNKIAWWEYFPADSARLFPSSTLDMCVGGSRISLQGEEAEEVYAMLTTEISPGPPKQLLLGENKQ